MPRMILLGVGMAVPDADRESTHMVWDSDGGPLLIDAGGSTYGRLLRAGIDPVSLQAVLLTHSHADHVYGFPILLTQLYLSGRRVAIPVYGLAPTLERARALIAAADIEDYRIPVEWCEVNGGEELPLTGPSRIRTALTEHSRPCLALRFESAASGPSLVYSGDTQPCDSVAELARDVEILIHEATTREPFPGHTTPRQAGEVAARVRARRLILVHFSPRWTMPEAEALQEVRAGGYTGSVEIGREQQVIDL